jgi:ribosome-associated heat shock protein Hsp15
LRIDKFLWFTRITKTRRDAASLAQAGRIRLSGRRVDRAHAIVRPGDVLTLMVHDRLRVIRVETLPSRRGPAIEAVSCYSVLTIDAAPPES